MIRRRRSVWRWVRLPWDIAAQIGLLAAHGLSQWQQDRRTAYRFGYPTPGEARRLRRRNRQEARRG